MRLLGWALIQSAGVLVRGNFNPHRDTRDACAQRKGHVRTHWESSHLPAKVNSEETKPTDTSLLDF